METSRRDKVEFFDEKVCRISFILILYAFNRFDAIIQSLYLIDTRVD